ncbi:hypothetical protein Q1695_005966 [Nippostrongylus brasiliensis]|nr:hypothetical protein Q1695_005966 [Nippostrongylus brasiliensis]
MANVEDDVSKTLPGNNKWRQGHRGKPSKQRRTAAFREKKNMDTKKSIDSGIRQRMKLDQFENLERRMNQLSWSSNLVARSLSITTRGIGFTSAYTYRFFKDVEPRLSTTACNINVVYRVNLALLQTQLTLPVKGEHGLSTCWSNVDVQQLRAPTIFCDAFLSVTHTSTLSYLPIASAGRFLHGGIEYVPQIMASPPVMYTEEDVTYGEEDVPTTSREKKEDSPAEGTRGDRFTPDPFTVTIMNLRSTVEALSDVATPQRLRRYFKIWNPIPGAIWRDDILTNPDDICPPDYIHREDLWDKDIYLYNNFFSAVSTRFKTVLTPVNLTGVGHCRALTALDHYKYIDDPDDIDCTRVECRGGEDICIRFGRKTYGSPAVLESIDLTTGALALLGERPFGPLPPGHLWFLEQSRSARSYVVVAVAGLLLALIYPLNRSVSLTVDACDRVVVHIIASDSQLMTLIERVHTIGNLLFAIVIPMSLLVFMTISVVWKLVLRKSEFPSSSHFTSEKRCVTRITLITTSLQLLAELPPIPVFILAAISGPRVINEIPVCVWNTVGVFLGLCNMSLSFFVYITLSQKFRQMVYNRLREVISRFLPCCGTVSTKTGYQTEPYTQRTFLSAKGTEYLTETYLMADRSLSVNEDTFL